MEIKNEWYDKYKYKEWYYEGKKLEVNSNKEALRMIRIQLYW